MIGTEKKRVLLADNSADYRRSLSTFLRLEEYEIVEANSVKEAKEKLTTVSLDLALVDLRLTDDKDEHDFSGLEVAKEASKRGIPCIIVTNYPTAEAARRALRSRGSQALAADFVPKGNGPQAILDTTEAVLGFSYQNESQRESSDLVIDLERGLVWLDGESLNLSQQQYDLLAYLYQKEGAVCSPQELYEAVYGEFMPSGQASADRRLERLVNRLREKIESESSESCWLVTVHGRGYRLAVEK